MGIASNFDAAFAKSQLGEGTRLPTAGTVFISVKESDKKQILPAAQMLDLHGLKIIATDGTAQFLSDNGVRVERVNKVAQGRPHIVDILKDGKVQLVLNTTEGWQSLKDSQEIREAALKTKTPYFTTVGASLIISRIIGKADPETLEVRSLQSYYSGN